jgi:hypothetical protein
MLFTWFANRSSTDVAATYRDRSGYPLLPQS